MWTPRFNPLRRRQGGGRFATVPCLVALFLLLSGHAHAQPNLRIASVSVAALAAESDAIPVDIVVANDGTEATTDSGEVGLVLVSPDVTELTGDEILSEETLATGVSGGIEPGTTVSVQAQIRAHAPPGQYRVGVVADVFEAVVETDEDDNGAVSDGTVQIVARTADLVVTAVGAPSAASLGDTMTLTVAIRNDGSGPARFFSHHSFYLSTDSTIDAGDLALDFGRQDPPLAAGETTTDAVETSVPEDVAPGEYFIGALADIFRQIGETDETNNASAPPAPLTVEAPGVNLVPVSAGGPAESRQGDELAIDAVVTNSGTRDRDGPFFVTAYLASGRSATTDDREVGEARIESLAAGETTTVRLTGTVPRDIAPGSYTVTVIVDSGRDAGETSEDDNTIDLQPPLDVTAPDADLVVSSLQVPDEVFLGQEFFSEIAVRNRGTGAARGIVDVTAYLSSDPILDETDLEVGYTGYEGLAAGETVETELHGNIPSTLATGTYTYIVFVDTFDRIAESDESNNVTSAPIDLRVSPFDLRITQIFHPAGGSPGQALAVFVELVNDGSEPTGPTQVGFDLAPSRDAGSEVRIDLYQVSPVATGLEAGESRLVGPIFVVLPEGLPDGGQFLGAFADPYGSVPERDETNNRFVAPTSILLQDDPPDDHPDAFGEAIAPRDALDPSGTPSGGFHELAGDVDFFRFEASAGDLLTLQTFLGDASSPDTIVALFAPDGAQIAENDDFGGQTSSRIGPLVLMQSGVHEISVRQKDLLAGGAYALRVLAQSGRPDLAAGLLAPVPNPIAQGQSLRVTMTLENVGDALAPSGAVAQLFLSTDTAVTTGDLLLARVTMPDLEAGVVVRRTVRPILDGFRVAPGEYSLGLIVDDEELLPDSNRLNDVALAPGRLTVLAAVDDHPASVLATRVPEDEIDPDGPPASGEIEQPEDVDFFRFEMEGGQDYVVETIAGELSSHLLTVYEFNEFNEIGSSNEAAGEAAARVIFKSGNTGTAFVRVSAFDPGDTGTYSVRVSRAATGTVDDFPSSPDEFPPQAPPLSIFQGFLSAGGDVDVLQLRLREGTTYRVEALPDSAPAISMRLLAPDRTTVLAVRESSDAATPARLSFQAAETGPHYVEIRAVDPSEEGSWLFRFGFERLPALRLAAQPDGNTVRLGVDLSELVVPLSALQVSMFFDDSFLEFNGSIDPGPAATAFNLRFEGALGDGSVRVVLTPRASISPRAAPQNGRLFTVNLREKVAGQGVLPGRSVVDYVRFRTADGDEFEVYGTVSSPGLEQSVLASYDEQGALEPTIPDPLAPEGGQGRAHVRLDGRFSFDPNLFPQPLTYAWRLVESPVPVEVTPVTSAVPTFVPTTVGFYTFTLAVDNGSLASFGEYVTIEVLEEGLTPVAAAFAIDEESGRQTGLATPFLDVTAGSEVLLDGTDSFDPDGEPETAVTYAWSQTAGPVVTLSPSDVVAEPTFVAERPGQYAFQLVVTDVEERRSPAAAVSIRAVRSDRTAPRLALSATAATTALVGDAVPLSGADLTERPLRLRLPTRVSLVARVDDRDVTGVEAEEIRFVWRQVEGPKVSLSVNETAPGRSLVSRSSFTPTTARVHVFECRVEEVGDDGEATGVSVTRRIRVIVDSPENGVPAAVARAAFVSGQFERGKAAAMHSGQAKTPAAAAALGAGAAISPAGGVVRLSGAGSRDLGAGAAGAVDYRWRQVSGPPVLLSSPFSTDTTFVTPSSPGGSALVFELLVDDGSTRSAPARAIVDVQPASAVTTRLDLFPGVDFVALPIVPRVSSGSFDSARLRAGTGAQAVLQLVSGASGGRFHADVGAAGGASFPLEGNQGYVVLGAPGTGPLFLTGSAWRAELLARRLEAGLNLVALPRGVPAGFDLDDLASLTGSPFVAYTVPAGGRKLIRVHVPGLSGPAPAALAGQGYLVSVPSSRMVTLPAP